MKKWLAYSYVSAGGFITILGLVFVAMYIWEGIISRLGEPDQSLLFWYLPLLFIGIVVGRLGLYLLFLGIRNLKTIKSDRP